MAITHKLDIRQGQHLVMTPQLQQAIKLLQLTNLELAEFVEGQLQENPFLEIDERASLPERGEGAKQEPKQQDDQRHESERELTLKDGGEKADPAAVIDTDYENIDPGATKTETQSEAPEGGQSDWASVTTRKSNDYGDYDPNANLTKEISLHEHLTAQLQLSVSSDMQRLIGVYLIDQVDDGGYLRVDELDVAQRLGCDVAEIEEVIVVMQSFDPVGICARSLQECLRLQLKEKNRLDPAIDLFLDHLDLLAKADLAGLKKATRLSVEDIEDIVAEIRSLNPKPGHAFGHEAVQLAIPDVYVRNSDDGGWKVELNTETLPAVLANQRYFAKLTKTCKLDEEKSYLSEQMSNANWLVKSLDQRARTILKVGSEIVRQQDAFFVHGVRHLRPLNLKTVADAIEMHESTVSRVTSNKYISTPRGLFELKYFFTSAIPATTGSINHSAESVRDRIKEMIDLEDPRAVLSDDKIVINLRAENVDIARRTVAKYREALNIPSSVQRRRLKQRAI